MKMKKRRRFLGNRCPLFRGLCALLTDRRMRDDLSWPRDTGLTLRQIRSARRNTRFRLVLEYNTAGRVSSVSGSRPSRLARKATGLPCRPECRV